MSETSAISAENGIGPSGHSPLAPSLSPSQRAWRRFRRNRPAVVSSVFLALLVILVLAWPWITSYSWNAISDQQFHPPDSKHWFGTDVLGAHPGVAQRVLHALRHPGRVGDEVGVLDEVVAEVILEELAVDLSRLAVPAGILRHREHEAKVG